MAEKFPRVRLPRPPKIRRPSPAAARGRRQFRNDVEGVDRLHGSVATSKFPAARAGGSATGDFGARKLAKGCRVTSKMPATYFQESPPRSRRHRRRRAKLSSDPGIRRPQRAASGRGQGDEDQQRAKGADDRRAGGQLIAEGQIQPRDPATSESANAAPREVRGAGMRNQRESADSGFRR